MSDAREIEKRDRAGISFRYRANWHGLVFVLFGFAFFYALKQAGDAYFINNQFRCSIGFSVQGGFVTAGHCGAVGDTTAGSNRVAQGTVRASVFPGDGDFGFVQTNNQWTPTATVATSNQGVIPVAGSQEAPVGASVCRTGSTTGTHCGTIQAKNATVNYPEGTVTGLTRTNVCAEGGDSGGSWISGDQAQGVTSGGSGDCTRGGTTFFQPVNEILQRANVALVTSGGNQPPPDDPGDPSDPGDPGDPGTPPAADCAGHEFSVQGAIARAGGSQRTNAFRANAGTHTFCIQSPAGAPAPGRTATDHREISSGRHQCLAIEALKGRRHRDPGSSPITNRVIRPAILGIDLRHGR